MTVERRQYGRMNDERVLTRSGKHNIMIKIINLKWFTMRWFESVLPDYRKTQETTMTVVVGR